MMNNNFNFRSLSGIQTESGSYVKAGCIYRSGVLYGLSASDLSILYSSGINTIIDFRTERERRFKPDPVLAGVRNVSIPVDAFIPYANAIDTQEALRQDAGELRNQIDFFRAKPAHEGFERMVAVYRGFVTRADAQHEFGLFIQALLTVAANHGSVLFHCSGGKDRTGYASYLILALLGVPTETIERNYLLSNVANKEKITKRMTALSELGANHNVLMNVSDRMSVHTEYLEAAEKEINQEFLGIRQYAQDKLGIGHAEIRTLRAYFTE